MTRHPAARAIALAPAIALALALVPTALFAQAAPVSTRITNNNGSTVTSVTAAGTPGTNALTVQGAAGGVPIPTAPSVPVSATSTTLGALGAACTVGVDGQQSAGFYLAAGTLQGTLIPEVTSDPTGAAGWVATDFYTYAGPQMSIAASSTVLSAGISFGGLSPRFARVRVLAYTVGTSPATCMATIAPGSNALDPSASGTLTASGQTVQLWLSTSYGVMIQITGTWTGLIAFEASADGANWISIETFNPASTSELVFGATTVNGVFQPINLAGVEFVRARSVNPMTGTASVFINGSRANGIPSPATKENGAVLPSYGMMIAGSDGAATRYVHTDAAGNQITSATSSIGTTTLETIACNAGSSPCTVTAANTVVLNANATRSKAIVCSTGTTAVQCCYNATTCSSTVYQFVVGGAGPACWQIDGSGGKVWTGGITCAGVAGGAVSVVGY